MLRGLILCGACLALSFAPRSSSAQAPTLAGGVRLTVKAAADKLGVKPGPDAPDEIELGHSLTTALVEPAKLEKYGIKGMHEGARVTITRIAPDKLRVDADEMEPAPANGAVTLRIGADGELTPVPDSPKKPPTT